MDLIIWAVLFILFVIAEFSTVQLISIWFAVGSLITMLCTYFFDIPLLGQIGIFIATSAILLAVTFPLVRKRINPKAVATNADLDIGKSASVIEEIDRDKGTGRVTLNGVDWSAVPEDEDKIIPAGTIVIVRKVQGTKLVVAEKTNPAANS